MGKEYICLTRLHSFAPKEDIIKTIELFRGKIYQRPPLRSSVKRAVRIRTVYDIEVLEINNRFVLMRVDCEAGTYMRKLCYDIGEILGVGASMVELRRTRVGPFSEDDHRLVYLHEVWGAYTLWKESGDESELRRVVRPMEEIVSSLPPVIIRDTSVDAICHGANLAVPGILALNSNISRGKLVAIYTKKGELVALARAIMSSKEIERADKGIAFKTVKVLMDPDVYPRTWK